MKTLISFLKKLFFPFKPIPNEGSSHKITRRILHILNVGIIPGFILFLVFFDLPFAFGLFLVIAILYSFILKNYIDLERDLLETNKRKEDDSQFWKRFYEEIEKQKNRA